MNNPSARDIVDDPAVFDAYCIRYAIDPHAAFAELANMALGLPVDILDFLRGQRCADGAAA